MKQHNQIRQVVFPVLAALIWGTAFVAQDICADRVDTFTFNMTRFYIAGVALLLVIQIFGKLRKGASAQTDQKSVPKDILLGGFCCGTCLAIGAALQQAGIEAGTEAGKAGFITALYVVLVPVFGLFFKRRVSLPVWIAVALSVVALYLLCIKGDLSLAPGDLLILLCAVCFAAHILVVDHFIARVDGMKLSCAQFLVAATWSLLCMLLFRRPDWRAVLDCALPILYVGIFSSCIGYTLQILAQKGSNPTVVTILLSLESVFAVISGAIILHQRMTGREYLGCVLMFVAVILAQLEFPLRKKEG